MQGTPVKTLPSKNSSLRAQIENKLLTDKKLDNKENLKKYNSQAKSTNQSNFYSCSNQQTSNHQLPDEHKINEKTILQYESLENPHFFGYSQWLQLNKKVFKDVDEKYIKILWKIMRTINYGEVLIPSGLVFQVVQALTFQKNQEKDSLKNILNNFLQMNNVPDRVNNFRELKNYSSLQEVQNAYKHMKFQKNKSYPKKKICESLGSSRMSQKNVFDRNYENYKSRNLSKNKQHFKRLLEIQTDPECVFRPKINQYCPEKLFVDQSSRPLRECHLNSKWASFKLTNNDDLIQNSNFKATPFQRSRVQNQSLQSIPGATQHINRCKYSEAKKRKIQRYYQNPTHVFKNY